MDYFVSILVRELTEDKFRDLVKLLEKFSTLIVQVEKDTIIGQTNDLNVVFCLLKLKETYPEARFGFSQYLGLAKGLSKIANFGEILISEEMEPKMIEQFQLTSLGMLSIEGMKSQILVCRVDTPAGEKKFPESRALVPPIKNMQSIEAVKNLLSVSKTILVYGAAGIGKTMFIDQLIEELPDRQVFRTCCPSYPTQMTLRAILEICSQVLGLTGIKSIDDRHQHISKRLKTLGIKDIGTTYLAILDFLGLEDDESILEKLDVKTRQEIISKSVAEMLRLASWEKPVLVIIEDIDTIDASSAGFIQNILPQLVDESVVFIFTSCRVQVGITGLRECEFTEIDHKELEDYVEKSIGERINLPPTGPLHVSQYIALYKEEKLAYSYNQYRGEMSLVNFSLPFADFKSLVKRRVELLSERKDALYALAMFGIEIDPLEFPGEYKELQRFEYFVDKNYLKRYGAKYIFVSSLLHEAVYEMIPDRESRHARNADYYRRLEGYEGHAAFHYLRSANYKKAIEYLLKAAKSVLKKGACNSGIAYYNQALELCRRQKEVADLEILVAINEGLADIYRALGDEEKALKYYKVVLDSYKEILRE